MSCNVRSGSKNRFQETNVRDLLGSFNHSPTNHQRFVCFQLPKTSRYIYIYIHIHVSLYIYIEIYMYVHMLVNVFEYV